MSQKVSLDCCFSNKKKHTRSKKESAIQVYLLESSIIYTNYKKWFKTTWLHENISANIYTYCSISEMTVFIKTFFVFLSSHFPFFLEVNLLLPCFLIFWEDWQKDKLHSPTIVSNYLKSYKIQ